MAFILTSCSHCQMTVKVLSKLQNEYGPRGLQVLASAIEAGLRLPDREGYARRASDAMRPYRREAVGAIIAEQVAPALRLA